MTDDDTDTDAEDVAEAIAEVERGDGDRVPQLGGAREATWEDVGRDAVIGELVEGRQSVVDAFFALEDALITGEELDVDDVKDARMALNRARRVLEEHVATVTDGTGAWGSPLPSMPHGRARTAYNDEDDGGEIEYVGRAGAYRATTDAGGDSQ